MAFNTLYSQNTFAHLLTLTCSDYYGALNTGMRALLLRRPNYEYYDSFEDGDDTKGVEMISDLDSVRTRLQ